MKRQMKASAVALLVSGCLLALSAGAAPTPNATKPNAPEQCTFDCQVKANRAIEACAQSCPQSKDPKKRDTELKCLTRCSDKRTASLESCNSSCPKAAPTHPSQESTQKPPAPTRTP